MHTKCNENLLFEKLMASPIKTVLDTLLNRQDNWQLQLLTHWSSIIGSMKTNVQLLKIYEDTLVIGVMDSCWLQELYLLTPLLLRQINEKLDKPRIQNLRFKALGIKDKPHKKNMTNRSCAIKQVQLSLQEKERLASIKDEQLREALQQYLYRCHREK